MTDLIDFKPFDHDPIAPQLPVADARLKPLALTAEAAPTNQIGLCLSGGGYRAMLFHLGTIIRLNEIGALKKINRISSVSGGSITSAQLALSWNSLTFDSQGIATNLIETLVAPVRSLAEKTIQWKAIAGSFLGLRSSKYVASCYDRYLYQGKTLQDFPAYGEGPLFVINATSLQTGALWRFSKYYMADYLVGEIKNPTCPVARAVAASSAFPPFLAPAIFKVKPSDFAPTLPTPPLFKPPYNERIVMVDGGVYDNLGMETVWKTCQTVFVSDGGLKWDYAPKPCFWWAPQFFRVFTTEDNQIRSLRLRQLIYSYQNKIRAGAYWGIRTDPASYLVPPALPYLPQRHIELEQVATSLAYIEPEIQERLINLGYLICDSALRSYGQPLWPSGGITLPTRFPYTCGI